MSHFTVGIFTKSGEEWEIERALEPYQENNMDNCPKKYLKFYNLEVEGREEFEDESNTFKDEYGSFETFMEEYYGAIKDYETEKYGYWENPNSKWDWYVIGGRWKNSIKTIDGDNVDSCLVENIIITDDEKYKNKIRFWELIVEDDEPKNKEEEDVKKYNFYSPKYYTELYDSKEDFAERESKFFTYAFITENNTWNEPGEMGWFGMSDLTKDSKKDYEKLFAKYLEYAKDKGLYITVVDCHI